MQESPQTPDAPEITVDVVEEASLESFPASDAPAWATGQLHGEESPDEAQPLD